MLDPADAEQEAYGEFSRARRKEIFGRLTRRVAAGLLGRRPDEGVGRLVCFGQVSKSLGVPEECCRFFEVVGVGRLSGSVGRFLDFGRGFFPVCSCLGDGWRDVHRALREGQFLPPVELYKLGGEYFVLDGNHRVSMARHRGVVTVDAMVTEFLAPCGC